MDEVRRLRKLKGLTQVELGELSGVSAYTITEIENGHREPRGSTLRKLAAALEVEIPALFERSDSPKARRSSPEAPESHAGEERNKENVWKAEYLALAGALLDKWEDELEEKLALAESDPVRFFDWVEGVRAFGRPLRSGLDSGYTATSVYRLEPIASAAWFVGPWNALWDRIEEVATLTKTLTEEDQKRLLEVSEDARRPSRFDGSA